MNDVKEVQYSLIITLATLDHNVLKYGCTQNKKSIYIHSEFALTKSLNYKLL